MITVIVNGTSILVPEALLKSAGFVDLDRVTMTAIRGVISIIHRHMIGDDYTPEQREEIDEAIPAMFYFGPFDSAGTLDEFLNEQMYGARTAAVLASVPRRRGRPAGSKNSSKVNHYRRSMKLRIHVEAAGLLLKADSILRQTFLRQIDYLTQDFRHPSLQTKQYDASRAIWQACVDASWLFFFRLSEDSLWIEALARNPMKGGPLGNETRA